MIGFMLGLGIGGIVGYVVAMLICISDQDDDEEEE